MTSAAQNLGRYLFEYARVKAPRAVAAVLAGARVAAAGGGGGGGGGGAGRTSAESDVRLAVALGLADAKARALVQARRNAQAGGDPIVMRVGGARPSDGGEFRGIPPPREPNKQRCTQLQRGELQAALAAGGALALGGGTRVMALSRAEVDAAFDHFSSRSEGGVVVVHFAALLDEVSRVMRGTVGVHRRGRRELLEAKLACSRAPLLSARSGSRTERSS